MRESVVGWRGWATARISANEGHMDKMLRW